MSAEGGPRPLVLACEDEERIIELLRTLTEPLGVDLIAARDGATALAYLAARRPALMTLDLVLPTGDRHRGLGDGTVSLQPSLLAGKEIAPLVIQGQLLGVAPSVLVAEGRAQHPPEREHARQPQECQRQRHSSLLIRPS